MILVKINKPNLSKIRVVNIYFSYSIIALALIFLLFLICLSGIPELFIPSCEPLYIPEIVMNQGNKGSVSVQSIYRNISVYGPSQFILKGVR